MWKVEASPQAAAFEEAIGFCEGETGNELLDWSPSLNPWGEAANSVRSQESKPCSLSELGIWGSLPLLKTEAGVQTVHSSGRSWALEVPSGLSDAKPGLQEWQECVSFSYHSEVGDAGVFLFA